MCWDRIIEAESSQPFRQTAVEPLEIAAEPQPEPELAEATA